MINSISYRVKLAREASKLSQTQLSKAVGISQGTLGDLERGKNKSSLKLAKIADVLGVTAIWLSEGKGSMYATASSIFKIKEKGNEVTRVQAAVCVPILAWEDIKDYPRVVNLSIKSSEQVNTTIEVKEHTYALRVRDDKMAPEFNEGDTIIVEPHMKYQSGDFVIVAGEGDVTFKQLISDGSAWILKPMNDRYPIVSLLTIEKVCGVVRCKQKIYR